MKPYGPTDLKRLHRTWRRRTALDLGLVLDGVQNPFNLGSIARHAAAYRVTQAWLVGPDDAFAHPRVHKTAMGSERFVPWEVVATTAEATSAARAAGLRLVGLELAPGAVPLFELELTGPTAVVVGHEERGLSRAGLDACDALAFLPQAGRVGSLNVAAATAIALYELRRQEWTASAATGGDGDAGGRART